MTSFGSARPLSIVLFGSACLLAAALIALPPATVVSDGLQAVIAQAAERDFPGLAMLVPLSPERLAIGVAVALLPAFAIVWALLAASRVFRNYAEGAVLTYGSAEAIRHVGVGLVAAAALSVLCHPLVSLILSVSGASGGVSFRLGSSQIGLVLIGAFVVIIGRAMRDAAAAAEDSRSII